MDNNETELHRVIVDLKSSIDNLRIELVRKDVYESNERARDREVLDLREDVKELKVNLKATEDKRAADRRLVMTSFVAPFLLALVMLYVAAQFGGPTLP